MGRKINVKFVGILLGSAATVGVAGAVAQKFLVKDHPERYIAMAHQAELDHQWPLAVTDWSAAASLSPSDPSIFTALGSALHRVAEQDPDVARHQQDRTAWEHALEIEPNYVPAIKALLSYWRAALQESNDPQLLRLARDRALQLHTLAPNDPGDAEVQTFLYTTTVDAWIAGVETDPHQLDLAVQHIQALQVNDPANADLPYELALMDIHRATDLMQAGGDKADQAAVQFSAASGLMDKALARQQENPLMYFRAAQINYRVSQALNENPDLAAKYMAVAREQMDRAMALLKGNEPRYVEVAVAATRLALVNNNAAKADAIARQLLKDRGDADVVMANAPLLSNLPDIRPDAIETVQAGLAGAGNNYIRKYDLLRALVQLQIPELADSRDPAEQQSLKTQIKQNLDEMDGLNLSPVQVIELRGQLALTQHEYVEALQVLGGAAAGDDKVAQDPVVISQLAQAYQATNENAQAEEWLAKLEALDPTSMQVHKSLARTLLGDAREDARHQLDQQMDYLMRVAPKDVDVIELEMERLDPARDHDAMMQLYEQLPEATPANVHAKAVMASNVMHDPDEASRLLRMLVKMTPKDDSAALQLSQVEVAQGHRDQAIATLNDALAANPNSVPLQLQLKELQDSSQDLQQFVTKLISEEPNPFKREMALASLAQQHHDAASQEGHLKAAEAASPTSAEPWDGLFQLYCDQKRFDDAQYYMKKLVAVNADQANGLMLQFSYALAKGDADLQLDLAKQLVATLPEFAKSYYCMGLAWQGKGQFQQAVDNYDTALQKNSTLLDALVAKAKCLYALGQPQAAKATIDEGLRQFPQNTQLQTMSAEYQMQYGDPSAAVPTLEQLRLANPGDPQLWLSEAHAEVLAAKASNQQGDSTAEKQALDVANNILKHAIAAFPDYPPFYAEMSQVLMTQGDSAGAEQVLIDLSQRSKWEDTPVPHLMLASFHRQTGRISDAEDEYRKAYALSNHDVKVQSDLARLLAMDHRFDEAIAVLEGDNVDNPTIIRQRVQTLMDGGRLDEADALLSDLTKTASPDQAYFYASWAQIAISQHKLDLASDRLAKSLASDPNNILALRTRAQLHLDESPPQLDEAVDDLKTASDLAPDNVQLLSDLATVYLYRFDTESASHVLEAALHKDPSQLNVRLRLAEIYIDSVPARLDLALDLLKSGELQPGAANTPELVNAESMVYQAQGQIDQALACDEDGLTHNPGNPLLARTHLNLLLASGNAKGVLDESAGMVKQHPELWWLWAARGQAQAKLGDTASALDQFKQGLAEADQRHDVDAGMNVVQAASQTLGAGKGLELMGDRSDDPRWTHSRIILLHENHQDNLADQLLDQVVQDAGKLPPQDRLAVYVLAGKIYASTTPQPEVQKAYSAYTAALATNPNDLQSLNNLACLCADGFSPPRVDEGMGYIRKAMDLATAAGTSDPSLDDTYGWLLIISGHAEDGLEILRRVVDRKPFPEAYYHLASGYKQLNRLDDAQAAVNQGFEQITKAQSSNQTVDPAVRTKLEELSSQILDLQRGRGAGSSVQ